MTLSLRVDGFGDERPIPSTHAVGVPADDGRASTDGGNRNPRVRWSGAPSGTQSCALLLTDTDVPADLDAINAENQTIGYEAPRREMAHWLVVDIPPTVTEIAEGADSNGITPHGKPTGPAPYSGVRGANLYTDLFADNPERAGTYGGYDGPFPPWNDERVHHYHLRVCALDVPSLGLSGAFKLDDVRRAMKGHVLDEAERVGTYTLSPPLLGHAETSQEASSGLTPPPA